MQGKSYSNWHFIVKTNLMKALDAESFGEVNGHGMSWVLGMESRNWVFLKFDSFAMIHFSQSYNILCLFEGSSTKIIWNSNAIHISLFLNDSCVQTIIACPGGW